MGKPGPRGRFAEDHDTDEETKAAAQEAAKAGMQIFTIGVGTPKGELIRAKDERGRDIIYALSTTCTHLGCTPNWLEAEKKFKCPCHGSGFKISGVNFEGPAPRPLERYAIRISDDGQILVDKSRKFQRELGQWDDPDSYILLG